MEPNRPALNPPNRVNGGESATPAPVSKIQHTKTGVPGIILPADRSSPPAAGPMPIEPPRPVSNPAVPVEKPLPIAGGSGPALGGGKITTFGKERRHEDTWSRTPNTTGTGAIHVKTFHCKLTEDALGYMDQSINDWLDAHPQYEVKFVTTSIGTMTGKLKEPALFCQVWV